jgi:isoleucyl-tRNA synthetase
MKDVQKAILELDQAAIRELEKNGTYPINIEGETFEISTAEVEILSEDIPGWLVASSGRLTVALDITLTDELKNEGIARELVNRIQQLRKSKGFEVTDHILVKVEDRPELSRAVHQFKEYICSEILADELELSKSFSGEAESVEIEEENLSIEIKKV